MQAMILPTTLPVKLPLLSMFPLDQVISYDHRNVFCAEGSKTKATKNISRCHIHDESFWGTCRGSLVKDYALYK